MRKEVKRINGVLCIKLINEPMDSINFFGRKKVDPSVKFEGMKLEQFKEAIAWANELKKSNSYAELSR